MGRSAFAPWASARRPFMRTMTHDRRRFLQLLAASPLVSLLDLPALIAQQSGSPSTTPDLIATFGDALNVFDFEAVARTKLPAWHWAWMSNGAEDAGSFARGGWWTSARPTRRSRCLARHGTRRSSSAR